MVCASQLIPNQLDRYPGLVILGVRTESDLVLSLPDRREDLLARLDAVLIVVIADVSGGRCSVAVANGLLDEICGLSCGHAKDLGDLAFVFKSCYWLLV